MNHCQINLIIVCYCINNLIYNLIKGLVLCIFICLMSALTDESGLPQGCFSSSHNHLISMHLVFAIIIVYLLRGSVYGDDMYFYKCDQSYIIAYTIKTQME